MAMATRAYGQTKHPSKKAKASRSSSKAASLKTPWQPLHDLAVSSTSSNDDSGSNQTLSSAQSDNTSKGSSKVFLVQAKGLAVLDLSILSCYLVTITQAEVNNAIKIHQATKIPNKVCIANFH